MTIEFQSIEKVKSLVKSKLNLASSIPEWEREIFIFLNWWFSDEVFLSQKTSGSTGSPKEIKLHRETLISSAKSTISFFQLQSGSSALLCIPAKYIGGKMMLVRAIIGSWNLTCIEPKGDLNSALQRSPAFDFSAMIPLQIQRILESKDLESFNLQCLIIGGAAVSSKLEEKIYTKQLNAYSTYGMTETASHVALKKLDGKSYFQALDGVSFSSDSDSRLIIEGSRIPGSPLLTNDLVKLISRNSFKWLGRFDNIINSGGVKIVVEELEKIIATLLHEKFYVKRESHAELGETPVLVINSKTWSEDKTKLFLTSLKKALPSYWSPSSIRFTVDFEWTANGKLKRI